MKNWISAAFGVVVFTPLTHARPIMNDPNIWLENSANPKVQEWVKEHNEKALDRLQSDPRYNTIAAKVRTIVTAKDRIVYPSARGNYIRNFWEDKDHRRGLWRQTTWSDYRSAQPHWQTILDIDALNKKENKSWVYKGASCLAPADDLCLIQLSNGGGDKVVVREFQVSTRSFVKNGFNLPEAKTDVSWIDRDHLLVGTDLGPDTVTTSGYPRQVRLWTRGTLLKDAPVIFEGVPSDVSVFGFRSARPESNRIYVGRSVNFFESQIFIWNPKTKITTALPFPSTAQFDGEFQGYWLAQLRDDWKTATATYHRGDLISIPVSALGSATAQEKIELVYRPDSRSALESVAQSKDFLTLNTLKNVRGRLLRAARTSQGWQLKTLPSPVQGTPSIYDSSTYDDHLFVTFETFNQPTTLYASGMEGESAETFEPLQSLPARYDASDVVFDQFEAISKDGTHVPYFVVHKKNMKLNGDNPTLLYAYGGFEISMTPFYLGSVGKNWIEPGGVYVLANIRGGGEFGPAWHEAALKEHRQRAYDDFAAVAQDLIHRHITSPRRLGVEGGSNGGLLMGVAITEHPELYHAAVIESALLDMIRYTQMPPGASWIGEYGDPADPKMREIIARYSPYQNVQSNVSYPEAFFETSTADDRVQPGHTRKMVERMEKQGHSVLMYENPEGGHGTAADLEQEVKMAALRYVYLYQKLFDAPAERAASTD